MMTVEEKPDVTYNDVGGCKEQIEKMREVYYLKFLSFKYADVLLSLVLLFHIINLLMHVEMYIHIGQKC